MLGRLDSQVKVNGFRIEIGEVQEAMRSGAATPVQDAVVVGIGGNGATQLVGFLLTAPLVDVDTALAAARSGLRLKVPAYMHPPGLLFTSTRPTYF